MVSGFHAEICGDPVHFDRLEPEWDDLLARSRSRSVFLTSAWLSCWWRHFGGGRPLRIVLVRDTGGALVGAAPLFLSREGIGGSLRVLRFLGTEKVSSDYLDFLIDPRVEREAAAAVWNAVVCQAGPWDWVRFTDLVETSIILETVKAQATESFEWDQVSREVCPYLPLPSDLEAFRKSLGPSMRVNYRRKQKQLDDAGMTFTATEAAREMPEALAEFYRLHALRWRARGLAGNFVDPRVLAFHADVSARLAPRGILRIYWIRHGEAPIATLYALEYKRVLFCYQTGFDPVPPLPAIRQAKYSPGVVLIGRTMEDSIARGCVEFDFLRGPEGYKFEWTKSLRITHELALASRGNSSACARLWARIASRKGRALVKRLLGRPSLHTEPV